MGGIVVFQWGEQQLTLLQNRDNWEKRVIKGADWDEEKQIFAGRCVVSDGTWFGVSRNGRVAFLVDSGLLFNGLDVNDESGFGAELLPINFLKSKSSPKKFAEELEQTEKENDGFAEELEQTEKENDGDETGLTYNLIVADTTSKSMYYICKASADKADLDIQEVAFGVHTLSSAGLDGETPKDVRLKGLFNDQIISLYENKELPSLKELAVKFMNDKDEAVAGDPLTALFVAKMDYHPLSENILQRYGTTSTTVCVVKRTKKVLFYESYWDLTEGEAWACEDTRIWNERDYSFDITA